MLKERRNQGTIALLVITFIFLVVAAVMGFIQYQKVNTKTAYDRNSESGADSAGWLPTKTDMLVCRLKKGTSRLPSSWKKRKRASWKKILSESLAPTLMLTPLRKIRDISLIMAASFAVS